MNIPEREGEGEREGGGGGGGGEGDRSRNVGPGYLLDASMLSFKYIAHIALDASSDLCIHSDLKVMSDVSLTSAQC